eukprot:TRINITY_DN30004_c0_g1_i1.p1 TRINITY_DN30004_c0_g1~~TRINITY_DN30004_c0_g1_i1.p1  ORF type:complete len:450 (-),score=3.59 TRINITY_DN30004_c0_g1_i1:206-1555(-)
MTQAGGGSWALPSVATWCHSAPRRTTWPLGCPPHTNLRHFHRELQDVELHRTTYDPQHLPRLGGWVGAGSGAVVYKHIWSPEGTPQTERVVAKQIPYVSFVTGQDGRLVRGIHANLARYRDDYTAYFRGEEHNEDDLLTELGVYIHLEREDRKDGRQCPHIVRMLDILVNAPQVLYLVMECCDIDLFNWRRERDERLNLPENAALPDGDLARLSAHMLRAVSYLHSRNVAHRDISLENFLVLGRRGHEYDIQRVVIKLFDFGGACLLVDPLTNEVHQYFRMFGKERYRPPEMYSMMTNVRALPFLQFRKPRNPEPQQLQVGTIEEVTLATGVFCSARIAHKRLGDDRNSYILGQIQGYQAGPVDLFQVGVCMYILHSFKPPWDMANPLDPTVRWLMRKRFNFQELLAAHGLPPLSQAANDLMSRLLQWRPRRRPTAEDAALHHFTRLQA